MLPLWFVGLVVFVPLVGVRYYMRLHRKRDLRWYQFSLRTLLLASIAFVVLLALGRTFWQAEIDPQRHTRNFQRAIAGADRVVIRDGGFDCCGPVDGQPVLREITDPEEIAKLVACFEFEPYAPTEPCLCCGYPGIDWYRGQTRIALTSLQHGEVVRWAGFPGDCGLTAIPFN